MPEDNLSDLTTRLEKIELRNQRVQADKSWETSFTRRATISVLTYIVVLIFLTVIEVDRPFLGSCVPVVGFWLSTQSLPIMKSWWMKRAKNSFVIK